MGEQAADVIQGGFAEQVGAGAVIKGIDAPLEDLLMEVHAGAGFSIQRFGEEGDALSGVVGDHLGDVFDAHGGIGGSQHAHQGRFNFALAWAADFMMMILDRNADLLQTGDHLRAQVEELVARRGGVIAAVDGDVMTVAAAACVPIGFDGVDAVTGGMDAVLDADVVEDIKLKFRAPEGMIADAVGLHVGLGTAQNFARVAGKELFGVGFKGVTDEAEGGGFPEGVHKARG